MITVELRQKAKEVLQKLKNTRSILGERVSYILLSNDGLKVKEIAQRFNRHEHTIRSWIKAYLNRGIDGLNSKSPPGRPMIKGREIEEEIEEVIVKSPRDFGYQEEGWTLSLMIDFFSKKGIKAKQDTVRRALKRKGWVYKRFTKTVPKNAPSKGEKHERVQEIIGEITSNKPDEVFFVDEANFTTGPYVQKGWFQQGTKKKLVAQ